MNNLHRSLFLISLVFFSGLLSAQTAPDTTWTQMYSGGLYDWAWQVQQTPDGGFIMVGDTESAGAGSFDIGVIKTNENGITEWSKTYGGTEEDRGHSIQLTTDGGYIIAGTTASYGVGGYDIWLIKTDSEGNTTCTKTIGTDKLNRARSVVQTTDGGYILAGDTYIYEQGEYNYYLVKIDPEQGVSINETNQAGCSPYCYPNPTSGIFTVEGEINSLIEITNINGQLVKKFQASSLRKNPGRQAGSRFQIDLSDQPKGIYFLKTQTDSQIFINKVIVK